MVTPIDDHGILGLVVAGKAPFAFGNSVTPETVPLPHDASTMEEHTMGGTQPALPSPAKRPRRETATDLDNAEHHQLVRMENEDGLEKRLQGIDKRISSEVQLLKGDIKLMSNNIDSLAYSIRVLPNQSPIRKCECKSRHK